MAAQHGTTCRLSFFKVSPTNIRLGEGESEFNLSTLRVDGKIFESGKKKLRI